MIEKIVLGTVQLGLPYGINNHIGKPDTNEALNILKYSFENGIQTLDTANAYGDSREIIGEYHKLCNNHFKIISKCHWKKQDIFKAIEEELNVLKINRFDSYLFHSFQDIFSLSEKDIDDFKTLVRIKVINKIGVSVYGNEQLQQAINNDFISVIQVPYNLLDNEYQKGHLMKLAKDKGKEIHVRSVFLQGLFYMDPSMLPDQLKPLSKYLVEINNLCTKYNQPLNAVALAYCLKNKNIDKVLIGVDSLAQLLSNLQAIKLINSIDDEVIKKISKLAVVENELLNPVNWKK